MPPDDFGSVRNPTPGALITTTEFPEDCDYKPPWKVPSHYDGSKIGYGDLMTVVAHVIQADSFVNEVTSKTYALHHRSQRVLVFDDIEKVGWLFYA